MGVIWSIVTAVVYGSADFVGGLATKRERAAAVMLGAHSIGLVGVFFAALVLADAFTTRDFVIGAAAGLCGLVGVILLYRRLAEGPMQVVAPVSAVVAAAVPALWGLLSGERLSGLAWVGVAIAIAAIIMVSTGGERSGTPVTSVVIIESVLSGIGFGGVFILLAATESATAPWPVVGGRIITVIVLAVYALARREPLSRDLQWWWLVAAAGLGDTAANVTFLWAAASDDLVIVSVVSSLYPVSTVVLARIVLGERMTSLQLGGFAAAMTAIGLIASS